MGVPKFYRWLSERYACLSQVIKDHQIPEFDNLYLDMNGIIHPCSHPNDDDPHFRITEEQIFSNIFHYIEVLFRIIKPQKVFFMAVDGVAPRAKMNQQRSRRFRSAREAEENIRKALQKGEVLPTEDRFDSNCITPGTEFMVRLHEQLKYFVNKKISTDPGWQGIKIYLSGHETPGEGEHKIMDFIRYSRSQPGYDSNTRHCLYGLDADLIMLGLTSHDPHFSLLREEVRFGKNVKRINNPENITFHLLHLSLLREYIDWEFVSLKTKISFGYDVEKIIDDWILMGFLVGNDFIPNLPNFHINHDALPYLWQIYKDVMPTLDGYLHDEGLLNLSRFETYLKSLSKFDLEKFEDAYTDLKWLEGKLGPKKDDDSLDMFELEEVDAATGKMGKMTIGKEKPKKSSKLRDYLSEKGVLEEAEAEDDGDFTKEHEKYKLRYYVEKFELNENEEEVCKGFVEKLCLKYVEAIQWILHYYFNGISSWGWFFPYHYAPYVSDIKDFENFPLSFDIGKPFLPFEQLLAVLPAASKKLLPEQFQNLMIMEQSPIIDYYPLEFKTDLNGKRQDWEAVVLIPFIDERRLLDAMEPLYDRLNKNEKTRNRHSPCLLYTFDKEKSEKYPSSLPNVFPDLECCHASSEVIPIDKYRLTPEEIQKGLLSGVKLDIYFPGFPTLKHVQHSGELRKIGVKVFSMHSRGESMALIIDESDEPNLKELADSLLGQICHVGWPHLVEAFVTSVSDGKKKFILAKNSPEKIHEVTLTANDVSAWKKQVSCEKQFYRERKAVEIGMTHVIVEACQIQGKKFVCDPKTDTVQLEKVWSEWAVAFPLQVTVKNLSVCDETDAALNCSNVTELFPVGTECFMMAVPHYGSSGTVIEVDAKQNRVRVQLTVVPEPDLLSLILSQDEYSDLYIPARIMAKRLGLSSQILSQITGKVFLTKGDKETSSKIDIGLNLKFSKQDKEVLGYARRFGGQWTYSTKTEQVISTYQEKFPQVFDFLSSSSSGEVHKVAEVFPDNEQSGTLSQITSWLKTLPCYNQKAVSCGSSTLDEPIIRQIEQAVENLKTEKQSKKNVKVRVKPTVLYRPMKYMGQVPPDPAADFELFDRVVNVRTLGVAPYGLKGTIVGIHQGQTEKEEVSYEVLFDEPFMGGQALRGSFENKLFVIQGWSLLNLTHGTRLELKKKGLLSPQQQQQQQQRKSGKHLDGLPAGYSPSARSKSHGGAWHKNGSPRAHNASPRGDSTNSRDDFSSPRNGTWSPRGGFSSLRDHSGNGQRTQFSPYENSPRKQVPFQPKILRNPQADSPQKAPESPGTGQSNLSAKESERVIRGLLKMDSPSQSSPSNQPMISSPTMSNNPEYSHPIPPIPPTSPGLANVPSGILVLTCREHNWPNPTFSHHRLYQGGFITTVCVAGKLFQGYPSANIVESTESAASVALVTMGLQPPSILFSPTMMPNIPPPYFQNPRIPSTPPVRLTRSSAAQFPGTPPVNPYQQRNQHHTQSPLRTPPVSADKSSEENQISTTPSTVENEPKSNGSSGQRREVFIPHQVSLKKKSVANTTETKTDEVSLKKEYVPNASETKIDEVKTSEKSEISTDKVSPPPSQATATPQASKPNQTKGGKVLLAPSFFTKPPSTDDVA